MASGRDTARLRAIHGRLFAQATVLYGIRYQPAPAIPPDMSMEFHKNHFRSSRGPADEILSLRASADLRHELYGISIIVEEPIWSIMLGVFEAFADAHAGEGPGGAPVVRREAYRSTRGGEPKVLRARVPGALREELDRVSASMGETRHSALLRALEGYADARREEAVRGMRAFGITPPWERSPRTVYHVPGHTSRHALPGRPPQVPRRISI